MFHYLGTAGFRGYFCVILFISFNLLMVVTMQTLPEDVIPELYLIYKDAVLNGQNTPSARRIFANNKIYEVHVKRLKEVNGFKVHNLMIKEGVTENNDSLIYINNPVESKLPRAYLTLEEFKNALVNRVKAQKDELAERNKQSMKINKVTNKIASTGTEISMKTKGTELTKKLVSSKTETSFNTLGMQNEVTKLPTKIPTIQVHTEPLHTEIPTIQERMTEQFNLHTEKVDVEKNNGTENMVHKSTNNKRSTIFNYSSLSTITETQVTRLFTEITPQKLPSIRSSNTTRTLEPISEDTKTTLPQTVTVETETTKLLPTSNVSWNAFSNADLNETSTEVTKGIEKKTPKRKVSRTPKVRQKLTVKSTKMKRSTLKRPLVFMGQ